jgi:hypothetical protein
MLEHKYDKEHNRYTTLQEVIAEGNKVTLRYENLLKDTRQLKRTSNWWQRLLKVIPVSDINETMEMLDRNNEFLYELQAGIKLLKGDELPELPSANWSDLASIAENASDYATFCNNEGSNLEDQVSGAQTQRKEIEDAVDAISHAIENTLKDAIEAVGDVADEVISNANEVEDYGNQIQAWIDSEIPQDLRW